MPSLNIQRYKSRGKNFLAKINTLTVFETMQFLLGALVIFSLCYFGAFGFTRSFVLIGGVILLGLLGVLSIVFDKGFKIPKTPVMWGLLSILGATVLAGFFSGGSLREAFVGFGVETGTVLFVAVCTLLTVLVASIVRSNKHLFNLFNVIVLGIAAAILFAVVNQFVLGGAVVFTIGPTTIGMLALLLVTLIALARQFFKQLCQYNIFFNIGTIVLGIIGAIGLFVAQDLILWVIAGLVALTSVTYALVRKNKYKETTTPWTSVMLFFVVLAGLFVGGLSQEWQDPTAVYQDRPTLSSTLHVTRDALLSNPLFGVGPQKFTYLWDQEKTLTDIVRPGSHVQYSVGFGYFPTFIATTGIVGLFALVTFLFFYVLLGFKVISYILQHKKDDPLTLIAWMTSFVLIVFNIFSVGDITVLLMTSIVIGMSLAASVINGHLETTTPELFKKYRKIPYQLIILVVTLILLICMLYVTARNFAASHQLQQIATRSVGDLSSINTLQRVVRLSPHDGYQRLLVDQYSAAITNYVQDENTTREQIQVLVNNAMTATQNAIAYNPLNYLNYRAAGDLYRQLGSFGAAGAYQEAERLYGVALERKPYSSDVLIAMGQLYLQQGNIEKAKQYTQIAFNIDSTRPDVYVASAQIALVEDNLGAASTYLARAVDADPENPRRWSDLGVILFSNEQYTAAAESFARALALAPNQELYYYLGLSLKELGRTEDAEAIYTLLEDSGSQLPIDNLKAPAPAVLEVIEENLEEVGDIEL